MTRESSSEIKLFVFWLKSWYNLALAICGDQPGASTNDYHPSLRMTSASKRLEVVGEEDAFGKFELSVRSQGSLSTKEAVKVKNRSSSLPSDLGKMELDEGRDSREILQMRVDMMYEEQQKYAAGWEISNILNKIP